MQTNIITALKNTPEGTRAESILRKCVHCGFCTATCPTYQLLGDELDGPRGRIYQIKQLVEGLPATRTTQTHLDRCLTCQSCETTCPSGVQYHQLLDIGRELVEQQVPRPWHQQVIRRLLRAVLPYEARFAPLLKLGQLFRPILPSALKKHVMPAHSYGDLPTASHNRKMLLLAGCAQPSMAPNTNAATQRVLNKLGIETVIASEAGCCGAVSHHLQASEEALHFIRRNVDAWWPHIEQGAEAIIMTASGCGAMVKEYGDLLRDDPAYREKADRISQMTRDIVEILHDEDLTPLQVTPETGTVSFHCPCTLQHAQQLNGRVEALLSKLGFSLNTIADSHLCCGSAGTYSLLQPTLSTQLRDNKIKHLTAHNPDTIATANIGCQHHLQSGTEQTIYHWIELLDNEHQRH